MLSVPDLSGRFALVTGAAKRLGRHLAETLAGAGAEVVIHYNASRGEAEGVAASIRERGGRAHLVHGDFLDHGAERVAEQVRKITDGLDLLVNNVGNYDPKPVEESTPEEWRATLETNLVAPFALTRACLPMMLDREAQVVNIGYAGVDLLRPNVRATAYQISKTGLLLLTKTLAERFGPRGLRVNMISPGQLENSVDLPDVAALPRLIPLGRAGTMDDVARALLFLLQPDSYVTGINIDVAGGYRPSAR